MSLTLVLLAAGRATRYGRLKQLDPVGPHGACLMDYGIFDAARGGFDRFVLVVPPGLEATFADHAAAQFGGELDLSFVSQRLEDLPAPHRVPPERAKPWGTGHAVLTARVLVEGPFGVANADDHYGRAGYGALARHLAEHETDAALIGYPLADTLSEHGGVSRGICATDADGFLTRVVEAKEVRRAERGIVGVTVEGAPLELDGTEPASMNLWGFPHRVLAALERQWHGFLAAHGADPTAEFLLTSAVGEQVAGGDLRLRVLPVRADWFGMTFADDAPDVRRRIAELVESGEYPEHLREGLS
jgi:hypothetical protein